MCVFTTVMLGSTWAWFTAQGSSTVNEIKAAQTFPEKNVTTQQYVSGYTLAYPSATLSLDGEEEGESVVPAAPTGYELTYSTGTVETLEDGLIKFSKGIFNVTLTLKGTASHGYFGIEIDHPWFDGEPYYFETNALANGDSVTFTVSTSEPMTMKVTSTFCVADRTVPGFELFDGDTTNGTPYDFSDGELEAQAERIRAEAADALQAELDRLAAEEAARIAAEEEAARLEAERLAVEEAAKEAEEEANANGEGETAEQPTEPAEPAEPSQPAQPTEPSQPTQSAEPEQPEADGKDSGEADADKPADTNKSEGNTSAEDENGKNDESQSTDNGESTAEPTTPAAPSQPSQSTETTQTESASEPAAAPGEEAATPAPEPAQEPKPSEPETPAAPSESETPAAPSEPAPSDDEAE